MDDGSIGIGITTICGDNFYFSTRDVLLSDKLEIGTEISYEITNTKTNSTAKTLKLKGMEVKQKKHPLLHNLSNINIEYILFIDIETVRGEKLMPKKDTPAYNAWMYKMRKEDDMTADKAKEMYLSKAALYAEFGKIACISIGMIDKNNEVKITSYYGDDEFKILTDFKSGLKALQTKFSGMLICGHSIIGFDIPYIMRRMLTHKINIPSFLNITNEKPWVLADRFLDIGQWWKATGFYSASLSSMCYSLGIESPKQDIDGTQVSSQYYKGGINVIAKYCERDVFAVIQILSHFYNNDIPETFTSKTFDE